MSLFNELKRRNVFRVAIAYGVVAWVLAQIADLAFENFGAPDWVAKSVLFILMLGFPVAIIFAWAFELTPDGIKREKDVNREESITAQTGKKLNGLIISLLVVAVIVLVVERTFRMDAPAPGDIAATDASRLSIAVLPFDNRSNREEDAFFTEGIHDDLLTTMANIGSMKVISRTSVMEYKDTTKKIPQIAEELGVTNILEGGVQRSGNQVRINVQLIDAATDEHLWAEIYDRELTAENLFKIQSEVSRAIADALQATLSPDEAERLNALPTTSLQAYEAYLRGRQRWEARTADSTAQAVELFLNAIELDPNFAEAWAGLGDAYRHQVPYGGLPEFEMFPKAEEAINRALALNPDLAEAHAALGGLTSQRGGDVAKAKYHLERAIELNPSYSPAYNWLGLIYNGMADYDKSIETFRKGQQVDPLSAVLASNLAWAAGFAGRHDEMKERLDRIAETHPESPFAYTGEAAYHSLVKGRYDLALRATLLAVRADPNDTQQRVFASRHLRNLGDMEASDNWLGSAFGLQPDNLEAHVFRILGQVEDGQLEQATAGARQIIANYGNTGLLWGWIAELLVRADLESGNPEAAIARYADAYPEHWGQDPRPLDITAVAPGMEMVRLLRATGRNDEADALLDEVIGVLEAAPVVGPTGSGFLLAAAYAQADRLEDAHAALRAAIDAGYRSGWRYLFDYSWVFESLRDSPRFQSMRIELAADMQKQLDNARRMQANGEMPEVPGMEILSQPAKDGAPPI